ncbi:MAG: SUMF1/EgtB/PvdO family nonheme iron enzyme [Candidatus Krumholzibacteriota bacterium]|nr:SUMF1/EgtB/PvdO family nonheme iron enzyme [Candidatus Krumholzibacteriota bacterium]
MSQDKRDELDALRVKLQSLAGLRDVLGDEAVDKAQAELEGRIRALVDTGGGPVIAAPDVGGDLVARDKNVFLVTAEAARDILRGLRPRLAPEKLQKATESYLRFLVDRHRYLNLKGMGVSDRVPLRLPLLDLYVPLKARLELPEGETWKRGERPDLSLAGRSLSEEEQEALAGRLGEPQPLLELLQKHDGLVVLGDPGAGKTTFVKFLALRLALGEGEALGLGRRLPVLLPLSAYANALAEGDVRLDDFVAAYFRNQGSDLPLAEMLDEALVGGRALVLLDGLDEVKEASLRHTVVERVVDFYALHRRQGNQFVLTSRVVGYRAVRPTAEGLGECTLVDFEDGEIEDFVARWTAALERQALGEGAAAQADAARERRELVEAIRRNEGVRQLAANPLLLTILALMKRQGVALPERRVELYEQYVRTLLSSWNRARGLGRPPSRDLDVVQTVRILAPLALWMHEESPGVGLVKREDLRRRLEAVYRERGEADPEVAARRFLADVREHAGLLLERGPGQYGFIHLTFEEYLAAVAIALAGQGDCRPIVDALSRRVGDPAWREVSLLTVPYLGIIQQLDSVAGEVVEALVAEAPGEPGAAAALAGQAVLDAGESGVPPASRGRVVEALVRAMQGAGVAPTLRREAGLLLGRLGWRPDDLDAWIEIPPGPFRYGDGKERREIDHRYWIGKYPVTNLQYARFVEDGGYRRRDLWGEAGWAWREKEGREQPGYWEDPQWNNPIFPVVRVSWYEAEAYGKWLTGQRAVPLPEGYVARLPTEEEWERAVRGADGREYPWGGDFDFARANVAEKLFEGIRTTAVCTYPQGVGPEGLWDGAGNVWEWTASMWEPGSSSRVVRGGSWVDDLRVARCAYRIWVAPDLFFVVDVVFRVVLSLSLSDSGF